MLSETYVATYKPPSPLPSRTHHPFPNLPYLPGPRASSARFFFSETSLFQFHHEGVWLVGQPCALGGPIPVSLVVELHVEFPEDFAEDEAGFGEEEPDDGSEESGVSW